MHRLSHSLIVAGADLSTQSEKQRLRVFRVVLPGWLVKTDHRESVLRAHGRLSGCCCSTHTGTRQWQRTVGGSGGTHWQVARVPARCSHRSSQAGVILPSQLIFRYIPNSGGQNLLFSVFQQWYFWYQKQSFRQFFCAN